MNWRKKLLKIVIKSILCGDYAWMIYLCYGNRERKYTCYVSFFTYTRPGTLKTIFQSSHYWFQKVKSLENILVRVKVPSVTKNERFWGPCQEYEKRGQ